MGYPGTMSQPRGSLYARLVDTHDNGIAWLRLAMAILAVAAAALVVEQKHLLAEPGPGLALVLLCALPFIIDAAWPHLLRPGWRLAVAMAAVFGGATALLAYRPADGDAAVLFFIALATAGTATTSTPAGMLTFGPAAQATQAASAMKNSTAASPSAGR